MDLSKLNSNERLAFWGAIASIVGTILTFVGVYGGGAAGLWLTFLLAIAMIVILFLPTWSPQTKLPGSKGSLMLLVGGVAAIGAVLALLTLLSLIAFLGEYPIFIIGLLIGIGGGLLMGWGAWQEFQAEGGKFQLGTAPTGTPATPPSTTPPADTTRSEAAAPPPPTPAAPTPAAPPPASPEPYEPPAGPTDTDDREERPNP
jgi:hypothetical protein